MRRPHGIATAACATRPAPAVPPLCLNDHGLPTRALGLLEFPYESSGQLHCRSPQVAIVVRAALLRTRLRQTNALTSLARVRVSRIAVVVLAVCA